jgi:tetratricopeptide (TPR) repeat protein
VAVALLFIALLLTMRTADARRDVGYEALVKADLVGQVEGASYEQRVAPYLEVADEFGDSAPGLMALHRAAMLKLEDAKATTDRDARREKLKKALDWVQQVESRGAPPLLTVVNYETMGKVLEELQEWDRAREVYAKGFEADPEGFLSAQFQYDQAKCAYALRSEDPMNLDRAKRLVDSALDRTEALDPSRMPAWRSQALFLQRLVSIRTVPQAALAAAPTEVESDVPAAEQTEDAAAEGDDAAAEASADEEEGAEEATADEPEAATEEATEDATPEETDAE